MDRRSFLGLASGAVALGMTSPSDRIVVGVMGTSRSNNGKNPGRGSSLAMGLAQLPGVEVAYVCDVDEKHLAAAVADVASKQSRAPQGVKDFRRVLDDKSVDALVIATPDHWHAPAAILGCAAGKHVYVEKPCSHNAREGELLVAAARKYKRVVQHGTQRRSWASHREAIRALREGAIGRVLAAKCYYLFSDRPSIGKGKVAPVPEHLDWALWQGPAPEREYRDNFVHYNWHWFWHWGTSELGNNGVHVIDVARWGLGVDAPVQVSSMGGKLRYDDDQQTPDTNVVAFKFPNDALLTWEGKSWGGRTPADPDHQVAFFGDKGTMMISGPQYVIKDPAGAEVAKGSSDASNAVHLQNFVDAIRGAAPLNAEIDEGFKSTLLCHLGNISYRTGRTLRIDPETRRIAGDAEAMGHWSREYRPGWEPKV